MTVFEIKEWLRTYRKACRRCEELEKQIARRRADMRTLRAVRTDSLPGGKGNTMEAAIEKIDGLERRLMDEQAGRDAALADVRALIDLVDTDSEEGQDGKKILSLRYIDGVRFEDIPDMVGVSLRSMWRRYNGAISEIAVKILK